MANPKLPSLNDVLAGGHGPVAAKGGGLPSLNDVLSGSHKVTVKKKEHHQHGLGGFVHNLGSDVVHSVAGIPEGIVQTVEHPVRTAKATATIYKATYGPLLHGDVSTFLHTLYTHPLGPILDAATVFTGGAALGAKVGILSSDAGLLGLRSSEEFAAGNSATVGKLTSHNPAIRARQRFVHDLQNRLPFETPHIGEAARHARLTERLPRRHAAALLRSKEARAYTKATRNLSGEEFAALHLIGNNIHPLDMAATLKKLQAEGGTVEPAMFRVLENPKVNELFDHPDAKLMKAVDAADALSQLDAKIKIQHGVLSEEAAAARIGKHRPVAQEALGELRPTPDRPFYVPDVSAVKPTANPGFAKQGMGRSQPKTITFENSGTLFRTGQLLLNHDILSNTFLNSVKYGLADDLHATLMKHAARISREEALQGRVPKGWEFIPKTVVRRESDVHSGKARMLEGLLQAKQSETHAHRVSQYNTEGIQKAIAKHRAAEAAAKKGKNSVVSRRAQQIDPMVRTKNAALSQMEHMLPAEERLAESFKVTDLKDAATLHGEYLIVPKSVIDQVAGQFTRSDGVIKNFLDKPFKVWRALVLGFRVGFLTNNLVGNHLLYAIHAAGTDGLRAYLNAVKREHGESMVKSLITMKGIPDPLRRQFMEEFFPEQIEGTFGGTQAVKPRGKTLKKVSRMSTGIAPATQAVAEGTLRRALAETYIRKSPEFKRVYGQLPKQTRDFEHAAAEVMHGEHGDAYQARVSEQVNNALGDYLNMGKVEQQVLRQIFPFYAWYRAILRITAHLAVDTPGRADILARIGQIGDVSTKDLLGPLPDYLLGLVPVGHGDHPTVLATKGANPFSTVSDIGSGVKGVLTGNPGETGKAFTQLGPNPFLLAAIQNLSGKNLFTGGDLHGSGGLPGQVTKEIAGQLPQVTLIKALLGHGKESKLYGKQTGTQAVEQFSGVPLKRLDKKRANRSAERR